MLLRHKDLKFSLHSSVSFQLHVNLMLEKGVRCPRMVQNFAVGAGQVYLGCTSPCASSKWKVITRQGEKVL